MQSLRTRLLTVLVLRDVSPMDYVQGMRQVGFVCQGQTLLDHEFYPNQDISAAIVKQDLRN